MDSVDIPEPYASIIEMPFDDHGWFENGDSIKSLFGKKSIHTVIEVGSWLGLSTRFIANLLPTDGKLYAVDHWRGSLEIKHLRDYRLPYLYPLFLSNIKHAKLTKKVVPIRMESIEAANHLNVQADFIYIDASHDTDSVIDDITAWYYHLAPDGILAGDDALWDSVKVAVLECAKKFNKDAHFEGNFWWYS